MTGVKISALPAAGAITGSELVPVVQSGSTVQTTALALRTNLPNSALSQINTSTTDSTLGNISRNGDWGFGTTSTPITDFTATTMNISQIFRSVSATGGPGVAISGVAAPYDGSPTINYLAVTPGSTVANTRAWVGSKNGATATPVWAELAKLTSPTFTSNIGLGAISTAYLLSVAGSLTSSTATGGINVSSTIQNDVTSQAYGVLANPTTAATAFTLSTFTGFQAGITIGAGSTVNTAIGFRAAAIIGSNATAGYGFYSDIVAGTSKWGFYGNGTADNYFAGALGIGNTSLTAINFRVTKPLTGGATAFNTLSDSLIQADVTGTAVLNRAVGQTQVASFTLGSLIYNQAVQGTFGAGSAVTAQTAFLADNSLIGATNNFGFRGSIASTTGRWNLYMDGNAQNYILGNVGIGSGKTVPAFPVDVAGQIRGTYVGGTPANALSAAGTTLATATVLAAQYNVATTVGAGQGVKLPDVIGVPIWVFNNQATNALLVYPFSASQTINALGTGAGFSLAAAGKAQLIQVAANVWYTLT